MPWGGDRTIASLPAAPQSSRFEGPRSIPSLLPGRDPFVAMAVDNLVNHAIKYSLPGSEVQVALLLHEREGESFALIQVKDQGPGLTPEDKAKAFCPFQRLSAKPTAGESSAGLGLSIVRQMVERHGGVIWVESVYGQGATFCID